MDVEKLPERLRNRIKVQVDGCWKWTGSRTPEGYGVHSQNGQGSRGAHRAVWEHFNGPFPTGMVADHVCHDPRKCEGGLQCPHRGCVNPSHIVVTTREANSAAERTSGASPSWWAKQDSERDLPSRRYLVDTATAALVVGVKQATIRSWHRRGRLTRAGTDSNARWDIREIRRCTYPRTDRKA